VHSILILSHLTSGVPNERVASSVNQSQLRLLLERLPSVDRKGRDSLLKGEARGSADAHSKGVTQPARGGGRVEGRDGESQVDPPLGQTVNSNTQVQSHLELIPDSAPEYVN
jgi:hypothetical protein